MTDLNKTIEYIFKLKDNVSATTAQIAQELEAADEKVDLHRQATERMGQTSAEVTSGIVGDSDTASAAQVRLRQEMDQTSAKAHDSQIDLLTQLTSVVALREGVSAVTGGLIGLGVVSDDTAKTLMKVNAAFSVMAGAVALLKSIQAIMTTINGVSAIGAAIDTYRATLQNPMMLAAVGLAAGSAVGVAGALMLTRGNDSPQVTNNSTTNITVQDSTPQQATSEIYQVVAGGAL